MEQISAFFDMGGYAMFIWGAFGVTALILIGLLAVSVRTARHKQSFLVHLQDEVRKDRTR